MIKKRSKKNGLPPGSLVHIGERKTGDAKITLIDYDETNYQEIKLEKIEECFAFKDRQTITWINIDGIHQTEILEKLGNCYSFHPLILEDILYTDQRPKMEDFGGYIYIVLKMLNYNDASNKIMPEQISIILGPSFVISFQEGIEGDVFNNIRERIKFEKGRIRKMGADYLAYSLLDAIVDKYFIILENLSEKIELIEEKLIVNPMPETLQTIHKLKRDLIFLRKSVWPLRELVNGLERSESSLIKDSTTIYLRDIYDHTIQVIDTIETFRDIVSGMLDIYLSSISNRMNAVMKVLTIIATIFMPLTFIVGVYGMNFKYMPELEWRFGYLTVWIVMLAVGVSMLFYFKKKNWL